MRNKHSLSLSLVKAHIYNNEIDGASWRENGVLGKKEEEKQVRGEDKVAIEATFRISPLLVSSLLSQIRSQTGLSLWTSIFSTLCNER